MLKTTTTETRLAVLVGVMALLVCLPAWAADITVTTTLDEITDDGLCSLREAVIAANTDTASGLMEGECVAGSGADTILLEAETYNLTRLGCCEDEALVGDLDLTETVSIEGAGQAETVIYGNDLDRVIHVPISADEVIVGISDLMVSHGTVDGVGGAILSRESLLLESVTIFKSSAGNDGGGLYSTGNLQMRSCLVTENLANDDGAGLVVASGSVAVLEDTVVSGHVTGGTGGGILNDGTLTMIRSTVELNQAVWGGGVHSRGDLTLTESTIGFNNVLRWAGGLANEGTASVTNSTISSNIAIEYGGNVANMSGGELELLHATLADGVAPTGDAIHNVSSVMTTGSIISGGCDGVGLLSGGGNIESVGDTCGLVRFRDKLSVTPEDLQLYPLDEYGGPTLVNALGPGSIALDLALPRHCPAQDQRGVARPQDGDLDGLADCDSGAFELFPTFFADGFESGDMSAWDEVRVP